MSATNNWPGARKRGFLGLAAAILVAAGGYGAYRYFIGSRYVSTDNAYSCRRDGRGDLAVGGIVKAVRVVDTQAVQQGGCAGGAG